MIQQTFANSEKPFFSARRAGRYLLAKIGADTAENKSPKALEPAGGASRSKNALSAQALYDKELAGLGGQPRKQSRRISQAPKARLFRRRARVVVVYDPQKNFFLDRDCIRETLVAHSACESICVTFGAYHSHNT